MTEPTTQVIRVMLADDHPVFTRTLAEFLRFDPRLNIVATAHDGEAAVSLSGEIAADLIILDLSMPRMNGLEAAAAMKRSGVSAKMILLTLYSNAPVRALALNAGMDGFCGKDEVAVRLPQLIRELFP